MRATVMYGAGDVRVDGVPDASIQRPTDAVVRVLISCVCGSDLWPYASLPASGTPRRMGHEFVGVVEELGSEVTGVQRGDLVVAPFMFADNTCAVCRNGLHSSCPSGGAFGRENDGGQAEAVRVPHASGTLVRLPVAEDSALLPALLTLSDVLCTGHHAAVTARVKCGSSVTVIGDGAVGLSAVIAARRLGAEHIILMGRHADRTALGRELGAADVVAERGEEGVQRVRELTAGVGTNAVLECVGTLASLQTGLDVVCDGGTVSRVGLTQYPEVPMGLDSFRRNITLTGGLAPARAYIDELLPDVLSGAIEPGRVFDHSVPLDHVADGYRLMADRERLKVLVTP